MATPNKMNSDVNNYIAQLMTPSQGSQYSEATPSSVMHYRNNRRKNDSDDRLREYEALMLKESQEIQKGMGRGFVGRNQLRLISRELELVRSRISSARSVA